MLIDDSAINIRIIKKQLEPYHFELSSLKEGSKVSSFLLDTTPDVILLDLNMPEMDGMDVLNFLQSDANHRNIPVIMLTAELDTKRIAECFDCGAIDYVNKPADPIILHARIQTALRIRRQYEEIATLNKNLGRQVKKITVSKEYVDKIINNMLDTLIVLTPDGVIKSVNDALCNLLGYKKDEIEGNDISLILNAKNKEENKAISIAQELINKGWVKNEERNYITKDGTEVPILFSFSIIYREDKKVQGIVCVAQDITEQKQAEDELKEYKNNLEDLVEIRSNELFAANELLMEALTESKKLEWDLKKSIEGTIETIITMTEVRDPYTAGHQRRVSLLACAVAKELHMPEEQIEHIRIASNLHDIGKIYIPSEILAKPGRLSAEEFALIKHHSLAGYEILKSVHFSGPIAQIVLQHHEKLDGSGYPNGLFSNEILMEAKIIGVADMIEAISSHRPYRPSLGLPVALDEIRKYKGIMYDKDIVDACIHLVSEKGFDFQTT